MTIREKVARAMELSMKYDPYESEVLATAAINAFLAAAAEPDEHGVSWHMRPDEATEEMVEAIMKGTEKFEPSMVEFCKHWKGKDYVAMLAAAPEFEWDK